MLNLFELREQGFIPKTKYKFGQAFPKDFQLPEKINHDTFKKLPLYIQVRYEYSTTAEYHNLNK